MICPAIILKRGLRIPAIRWAGSVFTLGNEMVAAPGIQAVCVGGNWQPRVSPVLPGSEPLVRGCGVT